MAAVEGPGVFDIIWQRQGDGGCFHDVDKLGTEAVIIVVILIVEKSEQWGCAVEGTIATKEVRVGEKAAPGLTNGGGTNETRWVVRREVKKDLTDEIVCECRRPAWRRRHLSILLDRSGMGKTALHLSFIWKEEYSFLPGEYSIMWAEALVGGEEVIWVFGAGTHLIF
jgi:hypothetical protein